MERQQYTVSKIRELIGSQGFAPGNQLPTERTMAEQFGVGRRTVRRALDLLEDDGLIHRRQGQGTFISPEQSILAPQTSEMTALGFGKIIQNTNPIEFMEVRLTLEPLLARFAAMRASQCDIKKLRELAEETRITKCAKTYERADIDFHHRVAKASKNSLFLSFFETLMSMRNELSWQQLGENNRCFKQQALNSDHHLNITNAISDRDSVRSHDLMLEHLTDIQKKFMQHA